jgi:hypothetical protein
MGMQPKTWMTLLDKKIFHFIISVQNFGSNLSPTNHHLLILDGHNLHVTLDVVHKAMGLGLNLITCHHTLHVHYNHLMFDVSNFSKLLLKHIKTFGHWLTKGRVLIRRIWQNGCL